jgi:hypothetical protein
LPNYAGNTEARCIPNVNKLEEMMQSRNTQNNERSELKQLSGWDACNILTSGKKLESF